MQNMRYRRPGGQQRDAVLQGNRRGALPPLPIAGTLSAADLRRIVADMVD
jgi:hypothetical protein